MTRTVHAFTDDALGALDAVGVAERIRNGEISAAEAVDAAIARVSAVDPDLVAVQFRAFDQARAEAQKPLGSGRFAGVPSFVKDNVDVRGMPTCYGSAAVRPHPAKNDGPPARQFRAGGFIFLGKTTMPEFGLTATTEHIDRPPTRNPWNLDRSAAGSSGGTAALVAAGAVPIAHGNDGGGSIRIPAAVNGLVGLKSTRARLLDQPGARQLPINIVGEGALTRTVRDCAHHLAAMEAAFPAKGLPSVGLVEGPSKRRLRIGLLSKTVADAPIHDETLRVLNEGADTLAALGHEIVEIDVPTYDRFPEDFTRYWAMFAVLMSVSMQANHRQHFDPRKLDRFTKALAVKWFRGGLSNIPALRRLRGETASYRRTFENLDVVLSPTLCHPAPPIGELGPDVEIDVLLERLENYVGFTPFNNVGGGPAISVPSGMMAANLPGSLHISADHGDERTLLELAYELEAANPFPRIQDAAT